MGRERKRSNAPVELQLVQPPQEAEPTLTLPARYIRHIVTDFVANKLPGTPLDTDDNADMRERVADTMTNLLYWTIPSLNSQIRSHLNHLPTNGHHQGENNHSSDSQDSDLSEEAVAHLRSIKLNTLDKKTQLSLIDLLEGNWHRTHDTDPGAPPPELWQVKGLINSIASEYPMLAEELNKVEITLFQNDLRFMQSVIAPAISLSTLSTYEYKMRIANTTLQNVINFSKSDKKFKDELGANEEEPYTDQPPLELPIEDTPRLTRPQEVTVFPDEEDSKLIGTMPKSKERRLIRTETDQFAITLRKPVSLLLEQLGITNDGSYKYKFELEEELIILFRNTLGQMKGILEGDESEVARLRFTELKTKKEIAVSLGIPMWELRKHLESVRIKIIHQIEINRASASAQHP